VIWRIQGEARGTETACNHLLQSGQQPLIPHACNIYMAQELRQLEPKFFLLPFSNCFRKHLRIVSCSKPDAIPMQHLFQLQALVGVSIAQERKVGHSIH